MLYFIQANIWKPLINFNFSLTTANCRYISFCVKYKIWKRFFLIKYNFKMSKIANFYYTLKHLICKVNYLAKYNTLLINNNKNKLNIVKGKRPKLKFFAFNDAIWRIYRNGFELWHSYLINTYWVLIVTFQILYINTKECTRLFNKKYTQHAINTKNTVLKLNLKLL
uniref:Uncharacterized protein n=1 Tax=Pseudourostyla cristata TaxID=293816 RepID=A0A4P9JLL5_9SPIT|nr:hypothetical protein [Pseudourostyla cristata]